MKTYEEYLEHARYLIDNHFIEGIDVDDLIKKLEEADKPQKKD